MTLSPDRPEPESEAAASQAQFGFAPPDAAPASLATPVEANSRALAPEDGWPTIDPTMQPALIGPGAAYEGAPERPRASNKRRMRRLAIELVETVVLAALIFFAVRAIAQNFRVEGSSMEPGLHNGQYLLVNKGIYQRVNLKSLSKYVPFIDAGDDPNHYIFHGPHRGDVIVFKFPKDPSRDFIKRVVGVPGDKVSIQRGVVFVNGVQVNEPYLLEQASSNYPETLVPERQYFVLGDNRANSSDSRSWGFVPEENIIGQAMFSYWPFDDLGGVGNHHIDLGVITLPLP